MPVVNGSPEVVEWRELLEHLLDIFVRCLLETGQVLILVVLLGLVSGCSEFLVEGSSFGCHVNVRVKFNVLIEGCNLIRELDNLGLELVLVLLHDVYELVLLLVEVVALLGNLLIGVTWRPKETPLSVEVFVLSELELELFEDAIDFHAGSDLIFELLDLTGSLSHLILNSRQVLNILRSTLDGQVQPVESIHGLIGHLLGLLRD